MALFSMFMKHVRGSVSQTSSLSRPRKSYVSVSRELILGSAPKIRVSVHALQTRYYSSKSEESKKKQAAAAVPEKIEKPDSELTPNECLILIGKLREKLVDHRTLYLETKEELHTEIEARKEAEVKLESAEKKLLILVVRSRIEQLEKKLLWPRGVQKPKSRRDVWDLLISSPQKEFIEHPNVIEFRQVFSDYGFQKELFLDTLLSIYGDFSDNAAHNVRFPREVTHDHIRDMFIDLGLIPDEAQLYCVELLLKPLRFKPTHDVDKE